MAEYNPEKGCNCVRGCGIRPRKLVFGSSSCVHDTWIIKYHAAVVPEVHRIWKAVLNDIVQKKRMSARVLSSVLRGNVNSAGLCPRQGAEGV
jgi:hypothetical protein